MNKSLANWLVARPGAAVLLTGVFGLLPLLGLGFAFFLPGAVPALLVLKRGWRIGLIVAVGGSVLLGLAMWFAGRPVSVGLTYAAWLLGPPVLLALLLAQRGSLSLCLQLSVLLGSVLLMALHATFGDPAQFWAPFVRDLAQQMQRHGLPLEIDTDVLVDLLARTLWGWVAVLTMLLGMLGLFLARWWQSLTEGEGRFGAEFRELRLGRALGLVGAVVIVAAVLAERPLIDDLSRLFLGALVIVGLAAAHRQVGRGKLASGWLWVIYGALVTPLSPMIVAGLAGWGFADNWLRSKASVAEA